MTKTQRRFRSHGYHGYLKRSSSLKDVTLKGKPNGILNDILNVIH